MSERKGWGSRLWDSFRGDKKISTEEALSQTGVDLIKTRMLETRIEQFYEFNQFFQLVIERKRKKGEVIESVREAGPEERLEFMLESANGINQRLHRIAIPWLTAGDQGWMSDVCGGWAEIYTLFVVAHNSVDKLMKTDKPKSEDDENDKTPEPPRRNWRPPIDKVTLVEKLEYLFNIVFIQYAQKIADISWKRIHVVPDKIAMIQNIPEFGRQSLAGGYARSNEKEVSQDERRGR